MPVATACLVKLVPDTSLDTFLRSLFSTELRDFVHIASRVVEPVIRPEKLDVTFLNCTKWDLLLFLGPGPHDLLKEGDYKIQAQVQEHYSVCCGIPSSIWNNYHKRSAALNKVAGSMPLRSDWSAVSHADYSSVAKDSQNLEASPALLDFADRLGKIHQGPVSQLNLLHFRPGKEAMESYHKYGKAFGEVASIRGGDAKLVGNVLSPSPAEDSRGRKDLPKEEWWNEISLVHYPSILHFIDMAMDPAYQEANHKYRLPGLRDTALICTTEIDLASYRGWQARL